IPAGTQPNQPGEMNNTTQPISLKATQPCYVQLTVDAPANAPLSIIELRWSGAAGTKSAVPSANLYPTGVLESAFPTYLLLSRAALLVNGFRLTAGELAYLWAHQQDYAGFDPNGMPLDRDNPAVIDQAAPALFQQWLRVRDYAALRESLP